MKRLPRTDPDPEDDYDDGDWTREQLDGLGWEWAARNGWENDDEPPRMR